MLAAPRLSRRQFLAGAAAGAALSGAALAARAQAAGSWQPSNPASPRTPELPTVTLGRTGRTMPRLGFGAAPISLLKDEAEAVRVVRRALEVGMRYFDTAPSYGEGRSETRLGMAFAGALRDKLVRREDLFVATKTLHRDAGGARRELEASLKRLGLEYVDSVQAHEVHEDWPALFRKDSVLAALERARDEGLVRHVCITSHRDPAHAIEAVRRYEFATALVPINPLDRKHLSYIDGFLPVAAERGVAVIAMKIYAAGHLVAGDAPPFTAGELVRYSLSQPLVAVCVPGCETVAHVEAALAGVTNFQPLSAAEQREFEARAGEHKGKQSEWYKNAPH